MSARAGPGQPECLGSLKSARVLFRVLVTVSRPRESRGSPGLVSAGGGSASPSPLTVAWPAGGPGPGSLALAARPGACLASGSRSPPGQSLPLQCHHGRAMSQSRRPGRVSSVNQWLGPQAWVKGRLSPLAGSFYGSPDFESIRSCSESPRARPASESASPRQFVPAFKLSHSGLTLASGSRSLPSRPEGFVSGRQSQPGPSCPSPVTVSESGLSCQCLWSPKFKLAGTFKL